MERWCGALVIVTVLVGAGAATGRPPTTFEPSAAASDSSVPLVARATISPAFSGFNFPLPSAPVNVFLNASAAGGTPPYRFAWDFGDGGVSAIQNATHTYGLPGTYVALLTVTDNAGLTATSTVVATPIGDAGYHWVVAQATPALGPAPLRAGFVVTEGTGLPSLAKSYAWHFGDGGFSNATTVNYTYVRAGTYVARLNLTDSDGVNVTYLMTVVAVGSGPPKIFATAAINVYCYADVPDRVSFNGLVGGGAPPYAYVWQFGDGNGTSTTQSSAHVYQEFGFHTANVTVVDASGLRATSSVSLVLTYPPCPIRGLFPWLGILLSAAGVAIFVVALAYVERRRRRGQSR